MHMNLSEPSYVTNQVRKGGILSSNLLAVYLDDLFLELNNVKPGCYMVEILLNDLMFADDIYVFWPSVRGLQSILDVCRAYAESHEIIFNCSKTVCTTLRLRRQKASTVIPLLTPGVQRVKSFRHYKDLGIVRDIELSDDNDIQTQLRYQKLLFPDVRTQWKMYFFVPSVRPCMHHNYGVISGRHTSTDCLGLKTLVAGHCTTCRGKRVLVAIRFNITFLPLRLFWGKMCICFSKDAESLATYGCALVYVRIYSLNNTTAFYDWRPGPSGVSLRACALCRPQSIGASLGIGQGWTLFLNMRFFVS